ncbi:MAG: Gfo/Idh/MocA family oxidoreductase, partial [Paludibacteraceae bacterium]|nr:Gfo/Idh/MocA family oxidoreductase [Paludibacteraceae bacterium]
MKRFALIGAAGYVAERHIRAIKETGNDLVCALDPFDVMGRMDSYFPEAEYLQSESELIAFLHESGKLGKPVDFVSICSPNHLHFQHIKLALENHCNVICEKPLVIDTEHLNRIAELESETGCSVKTVLQLRYHPVILKLREELGLNTQKYHEVDLRYITTRGRWYMKSWKGDIQKSGGIATNIGIHLFDLLIWLFGDVEKSLLHELTSTKASGALFLNKAKVNWLLSTDEKDLPEEIIRMGKRTFRSIKINKSELEFSEGFTELHTETYRNILDGNGFGI